MNVVATGQGHSTSRRIHASRRPKINQAILGLAPRNNRRVAVTKVDTPVVMIRDQAEDEVSAEPPVLVVHDDPEGTRSRRASAQSIVQPLTRSTSIADLRSILPTVALLARRHPRGKLGARPRAVPQGRPLDDRRPSQPAAVTVKRRYWARHWAFFGEVPAPVVPGQDLSPGVVGGGYGSSGSWYGRASRR